MMTFNESLSLVVTITSILCKDYTIKLIDNGEVIITLIVCNLTFKRQYI